MPHTTKKLDGNSVFTVFKSDFPFRNIFRKIFIYIGIENEAMGVSARVKFVDKRSNLLHLSGAVGY